MPRGRKPIGIFNMVDGTPGTVIFQNMVRSLELRFNFQTRSALWEAVAKTGWARSIKLTPQVAMLKAKAFNIVIKTPVGQRGRKKGSGPVPNAGRKGKRTIPLPIVDLLKRQYAPSVHKAIDRAASGSMKAAIKLKCLDCVCYQKKEVTLCETVDCPLWVFRPYQDKQENARILAKAKVT